MAGAPGRDLAGAPNAGALVTWLVPIDWSGASAGTTPAVPAPGAPLVYVQGAGGLTGHSERRHVLGEDDALVGAKTAFGLEGEQAFEVGRAGGQTLFERT